MSTAEIVSLSVSAITTLLALLYRATIAGMQKTQDRHEGEIDALKRMFSSLQTSSAVHANIVERLERDVFRATSVRNSQVDANERG